MMFDIPFQCYLLAVEKSEQWLIKLLEENITVYGPPKKGSIKKAPKKGSIKKGAPKKGSIFLSLP